MAEVEIPPYDARADRPCLGCGKRDKAYRDQVTLPDGNAAYYHADCHVQIANCEVCRKVLESVGTHDGPDGLKDEDLHVAIHQEMAKAHGERAEIFTTDSAIPQPPTAGSSANN